MANGMVVNGFGTKLILVTGGGSGIGKESCITASKMGATIIVCDLNLETAEKTKNDLLYPANKHSAMQVDVSCEQSVQDLALAILQLYGKPPSVVIHSAGILGDAVNSAMCTEKAWQQVIDVNLKGTFLINRTFARLMKDTQTPGSIVNLSSVAKEGIMYHMAYSASKAGVIGITKTVAQEFGPHNIRCNAVAPGAIETPLHRNSPTGGLNNFIKNCAMKRLGRPEEVAAVCVFLGSDASSYVNGSVIEVHGGANTN